MEKRELILSKLSETVFKSSKQIATEANLSVRAVIPILAEMERKGEIESKRVTENKKSYKVYKKKVTTAQPVVETQSQQV